MSRLPASLIRLRAVKGTGTRHNSTTTTRPSPNSVSSLHRTLFRSVAQPVAVITIPLHSGNGKGKGKLSEPHDHGATLSSLSSISLSPPLVAFSLRLPSRLASYLLPETTSSNEPPKLRIHLLSASQEAEARAFARQAPLPAPATPSPPPSSPTPDNSFPPSLFKSLEKGSLGYLDCEIVSTTELPKFGSEEDKVATAKSQLFIAKVEGVTIPSEEENKNKGSLVYWEQGYQGVGN